MLTGQQVINGKHYRFDNQGNMIVGTYVNNGQLEDYGTDGVQVINQQITDNAGHQFTFDANGNLARPADICSDGQFEFNGQWYLMNQNNQIQTGWQTIADEPGKQYYYDPVNGTMTKGQRQIDGHWYYFNEDTGAKVTNAFQKIADQNKTCYYDNNGWMVYGQQKIAGQWYLFDQHSGAMLTGFQYIPDQNKTCYYDPTTGQMQYGWHQISWHMYYFDPNDGAMSIGSHFINGRWYNFCSNGAYYGFTERVLDWFYSRINHLTYSMDGSRNGADGTADCSGSMTQALRDAGACPYSYLYNTESLHGYLLENGYQLVNENDANHYVPQWGDVIIWGERGYSAGGAGHTLIISQSQQGSTPAQCVSTCYYTEGQEETAVQVLPYWYYWHLDDDPYFYVYRLPDQLRA